MRVEGVLVDTSAWIEFLRKTGTPTAAALEALLRDDEPVVTTGLVVTELLRGCASETDAMDLRSSLLAWPNHEPVFPKTYDTAARLYRLARRQGLTVRSTVDCVIAAVALENGMAVLHRDRDFDALSRISELVSLAPG